MSDLYSAAVLLDSPAVFWRFSERSGTSIADSSGNARTLTIGGGAAPGSAGAIVGSNDASCKFDGTSGYGSRTIDLSAYTKLAVEFWFFDTGTSGSVDDGQLCELTSSAGNPNSYAIVPHWSGSASSFIVYQGDSGNYRAFTRPSVGAWHHYVINLDRALAGFVPSLYIDGAAVTDTFGHNGADGSTFANDTLYLMSRTGSSNFLAGLLDEFALYPGVSLSANRALAHYNAGIKMGRLCSPLDSLIRT